MSVRSVFALRVPSTLEHYRLGPRLCFLPGVFFPGVFRAPLLTSHGSIQGQLFREFGQGDHIENGTFPQALPFGTHILNHSLYAYWVWGIVLSRGFYYF